MKISHSSPFLAIRCKFSIMFNGVNLQRGKFILAYVIYIDNCDNEQHYRDIGNFIITQQPYDIFQNLYLVCFVP